MKNRQVFVFFSFQLALTLYFLDWSSVPHIMTGIIFAVFASVCQKKKIVSHIRVYTHIHAPYHDRDHFRSFCECLSEKKTIFVLKYRIGDHRGRVFKHLFEKKKFKDP